MRLAMKAEEGLEQLDVTKKDEKKKDEEHKFLPIVMDGVAVLIEEAKNTWRATPSIIESHAEGIVFTKSKKMEDRCSTTGSLPWGELIYGFDEGDGWLLVATKAGMHVVRNTAIF